MDLFQLNGDVAFVTGAGSGIVQQQVRVDFLTLQRVVGFTLARHRPLPGIGAARLDAVGGLACWRLHQISGGQGGHFNMQVDAVHQRAAELALVARHLIGRAAARLLRGAQIAAGAGVHRANELKARREF